MRPSAMATPFFLFSIALAIALAVVGPAAVVRADDGPALAVSVESADARVRPDNVRAAVARVLDVPIVSLLDDAAETSRGILVIVVPRGGRVAQLYFQMPSSRRRLGRATAPEGETGVSWIAVAVADFFRTPAAPQGWSASSEVLDPFAPSPVGGRASVASEVLDPWAISTRPRPAGLPRFESGRALSRPRPR